MVLKNLWSTINNAVVFRAVYQSIFDTKSHIFHPRIFFHFVPWTKKRQGGFFRPKRKLSFVPDLWSRRDSGRCRRARWTRRSEVFLGATRQQWLLRKSYVWTILTHIKPRATYFARPKKERRYDASPNQRGCFAREPIKDWFPAPIFFVNAISRHFSRHFSRLINGPNSRCFEMGDSITATNRV